MAIEAGIQTGRIRRLRRGLSSKRKHVLSVGLLDLVLCTFVALNTFYWTNPPVIKSPKTFEETVMVVASKVYFMGLIYKPIWATGVILVALISNYETWERSVQKSAFVTRMFIGSALLVTIVSTILSWNGTESNRMLLYVIHLSLHMVVPMKISAILDN